MGQQQLLLVILVTILVGIATVVALNVFGTAAEDANRDAVRQDLLQGATAAQAIYARPRMLDGAGGNFLDMADVDGSDSEDVLLQRLGMAITFNEGDSDAGEPDTWGNENGTYSITTVTENGFILVGEPSSGPPNIQADISVTDGEWDIDISDQ